VDDAHNTESTEIMKTKDWIFILIALFLFCETAYRITLSGDGERVCRHMGGAWSTLFGVCIK
jgi:hypothetical protein